MRISLNSVLSAMSADINRYMNELEIYLKETALADITPESALYHMINSYKIKREAEEKHSLKASFFYGTRNHSFQPFKEFFNDNDAVSFNTEALTALFALIEKQTETASPQQLMEDRFYARIIAWLHHFFPYLLSLRIEVPVNFKAALSEYELSYVDDLIEKGTAYSDRTTAYLSLGCIVDSGSSPQLKKRLDSGKIPPDCLPYLLSGLNLNPAEFKQGVDILVRSRINHEPRIWWQIIKLVSTPQISSETADALFIKMLSRISSRYPPSPYNQVDGNEREVGFYALHHMSCYRRNSVYGGVFDFMEFLSHPSLTAAQLSRFTKILMGYIKSSRRNLMTDLIIDRGFHIATGGIGQIVIHPNCDPTQVQDIVATLLELLGTNKKGDVLGIINRALKKVVQHLSLSKEQLGCIGDILRKKQGTETLLNSLEDHPNFEEKKFFQKAQQIEASLNRGDDEMLLKEAICQLRFLARGCDLSKRAILTKIKATILQALKRESLATPYNSRMFAQEALEQLLLNSTCPPNALLAFSDDFSPFYTEPVLTAIIGRQEDFQKICVMRSKLIVNRSDDPLLSLQLRFKSRKTLLDELNKVLLQKAVQQHLPGALTHLVMSYLY